MKFTFFKSGSYNTICDVCGFKYKASDLKMRWDGLMVCERDWEIRHPQELIRPIQDQNKLPWTRPESNDSFTIICTVNGRSGLAGYATAGCAIVGRTIIDIEATTTNRSAGDQ